VLDKNLLAASRRGTPEYVTLPLFRSKANFQIDINSGLLVCAIVLGVEMHKLMPMGGAKGVMQDISVLYSHPRIPRSVANGIHRFFNSGTPERDASAKAIIGFFAKEHEKLCQRPDDSRYHTPFTL